MCIFLLILWVSQKLRYDFIFKFDIVSEFNLQILINHDWRYYLPTRVYFLQFLSFQTWCYIMSLIHLINFQAQQLTNRLEIDRNIPIPGGFEQGEFLVFIFMFFFPYKFESLSNFFLCFIGIPNMPGVCYNLKS